MHKNYFKGSNGSKKREKKVSVDFDGSLDVNHQLDKDLLLNGDERCFKNRHKKSEVFEKHQVLRGRFLEKKLNDGKSRLVQQALECGLTLSAVKYIFNLTEEQVSEMGPFLQPYV